MFANEIDKHSLQNKWRNYIMQIYIKENKLSYSEAIVYKQSSQEVLKNKQYWPRNFLEIDPLYSIICLRSSNISLI